MGNGDGEGEFMYIMSRSIEKVLGVKGIECMFQASKLPFFSALGVFAYLPFAFLSTVSRKAFFISVRFKLFDEKTNSLFEEKQREKERVCG